MKDGRNIEDAKTNVSKAFPAADAAAYTDAIDLVADSYVGDVEAVIASPALANLANTKTATLFVQESAEESANFANIGLSLTVTGGASGAAAATQRVRFPAGTKRYVRLGVEVEANGGDNTDSEAELRLKY
jgi:hypothetical protein